MLNSIFSLKARKRRLASAINSYAANLAEAKLIDSQLQSCANVDEILVLSARSFVLQRERIELEGFIPEIESIWPEPDLFAADIEGTRAAVSLAKDTNQQRERARLEFLLKQQALTRAKIATRLVHPIQVNLSNTGQSASNRSDKPMSTESPESTGVMSRVPLTTREIMILAGETRSEVLGVAPARTVDNYPEQGSLRSNQILALWVGVVASAAILLIPPWKQGMGTYGRSYSIGYYFVANPPHGAVGIDIQRIAMQLVVVGLLTWMAVVSLGQRRSD